MQIATTSTELRQALAASKEREDAARRDPVTAELQSRWEQLQQKHWTVQQEHQDQLLQLNMRLQTAEAYAPPPEAHRGAARGLALTLAWARESRDEGENRFSRGVPAYRRAAEAQRTADASAAHFRAELASAREELGMFVCGQRGVTCAQPQHFRAQLTERAFCMPRAPSLFDPHVPLAPPQPPPASPARVEGERRRWATERQALQDQITGAHAEHTKVALPSVVCWGGEGARRWTGSDPAHSVGRLRRRVPGDAAVECAARGGAVFAVRVRLIRRGGNEGAFSDPGRMGLSRGGVGACWGMCRTMQGAAPATASRVARAADCAASASHAGPKCVSESGVERAPTVALED